MCSRECWYGEGDGERAAPRAAFDLCKEFFIEAKHCVRIVPKADTLARLKIRVAGRK
jgi:hypothetical protein